MQLHRSCGVAVVVAAAVAVPVCHDARFRAGRSHGRNRLQLVAVRRRIDRLDHIIQLHRSCSVAVVIAAAVTVPVCHNACFLTGRGNSCHRVQLVAVCRCVFFHIPCVFIAAQRTGELFRAFPDTGRLRDALIAVIAVLTGRRPAVGVAIENDCFGQTVAL